MRALLLLLLPLLLVLLQVLEGESTSSALDEEGFPVSIPLDPVRKDAYSKETVSGGRMKLLPRREKVSVLQYRQTLQCVTKKQYMRNERGLFDMMFFIHHTRETVERVAAWLEPFHFPDIHCDPSNSGEIEISWAQCQKLADLYKSGQYRKHLDDKLSSPYQAKLIRVLNQSLYLDFPWGMERFSTPKKHSNHWQIFLEVLGKLKPLSIGDSVFVIGEEVAISPSTQYVPFPIFSNAASISNSDLSLPWRRDCVYSQLGRMSDTSTPFETKIPKAAFFGTTNSPTRMLIYDAANLRPDLLDVGISQRGGGRLWSWNPLAKQDVSFGTHIVNFTSQFTHMSNSETEYRLGHADSYARYILKKQHQYSHKYQYLVVMDGLHTTADRLANFLKQDAVVLLQESVHRYHFSSQLRPYIHYVPFHVGDIIMKIEWLKRNPLLAKDIANNAKNFAISYLRIEDCYCHIVNALETLGEVFNGTTASLPSPLAIKIT